MNNKQQAKTQFLLHPPWTGPSVWSITFLHMKNRQNVFLSALVNTVGPRLTTGLRSRIFGCIPNRRKTITI